MSGRKGMANNTPRAQQAAEIVDSELLDLAERLARWPTDKRINLTELVARAGALAARCKRLKGRHAATIDAVCGEAAQ